MRAIREMRRGEFEIGSNQREAGATLLDLLHFDGFYIWPA